MKKGIRRLLLSERGDSSYISSFVYILVVAIMIAFIINVFHIISVKQEMDHISDQLVKQIQLNGGKSNDTDALFNYLAGELSEVSGLTYQVTSSGRTIRPIQIGTPFYVSVTGRCGSGAAFGNSIWFPSTSVPREPASVNTTGNRRSHEKEFTEK